ncbi:hypothetical protein DITRI_Ditri16bG0115200 [Diplodiscus trichospermus]
MACQPRRSITSSDIVANQTLDIVANLDIPSFTDEEGSVDVRGCYSGVICLCYYDRDAVLWNIATKEFKTLPIYPFESPAEFDNYIEVVCLGYDFKRDGHKDIRIDTFWNDDFGYEDARSQPGKRDTMCPNSTPTDIFTVQLWLKMN